MCARRTRKAVQELHEAEKLKVIKWPNQSPDHTPTEHACSGSNTLAVNHLGGENSAFGEVLWVPDFRQSKELPSKLKKINGCNTFWVKTLELLKVYIASFETDWAGVQKKNKKNGVTVHKPNCIYSCDLIHAGNGGCAYT